MSSTTLRLRLFGHPVVTDADGVPVSGSVEPQRLALLALLALHPKRTVSRGELTNYLWPTRDVEQARQALNQALFAISKALGDDAIFPSAKEVRLGTRVSVDALEFQSALDAGRLEDAMRLYTAPLMDGFELDGAPEFQHWAATQRARFATAARTQRPVAAPAIDVLHDLTEPETPEPEKPVPTPEVAPREKPGKKGRKKPEPPADFVLLAEPELQARVEQTAEEPEFLAEVPPDPELMTNAPPVNQEPVVNAAPTVPELMTNAVLPDQESGANVERHGSPEPVDILPPQSPPREEPQWIAPNEPSPAAVEPTAAAASPPATPEVQEDLVLADAPPAPVESEPREKPAKGPRRAFPRPSARLVVTVLGVIALGALGYMARGWIGAARGSIDVAREGIAAVRDKADAALHAGDRKRSIAVLPIEYSGRNPADAALATRIVAELNPMLTRAGLIVKPSSALTRAGPPYDLRVIADSLGVAYILQGVMQREGTRVAFRFRRVYPVDGTARWDKTYRPEPKDIPVLQEDVAATVGAEILRGPRERD
jgi:TolB-like protein